MAATVLLAGCSTFGPAPQKAPIEDAKAPPPAALVCSVGLYGDSILYGGFGANLGNRLPDPPVVAMRRMRPTWQISDHSVVGDSAFQRRPAFVRQPSTARVVVLEYGINDVGNSYDYEPAFRAMARHVKAQRKALVVTGLSRVRGNLAERREQYDATARRIAAEEGAVFADWGSVPFDPKHMVDDVHPSQEYSTRLVQRLVETLEKAAPECRG
ncbi:SGNH/GDSL hydrolase family protein [Variovorax sp. TBS-050B]|uniref:SGNH/GDSL hydrolase family protein n=1 Tax=Variovorax sp. TBS-050B TaxID=2940551 RepID=UPI00247664B4|nr:SGNH/GDSL hydrolase family protein [Variovorax sp. TBS-050B]